jgi:hypothetical protein
MVEVSEKLKDHRHGAGGVFEDVRRPYFAR